MRTNTLSKNNLTKSWANMVVQPALSIGSVDDSLEKETDLIADKVMRMPENGLIQRKCTDCEEEEILQRKPLASFIQKKGIQGGLMASDSVSNRIASSRGKGSGLPNSTKSFMESRFGTDFSKVNVHTGGEAVQMNRELSAKAFTVGSDIYFNRGQYNPGSVEGKKLLAHELSHTLQQEASGISTISTFLRVGSTNDSAEVEANDMSEKVMKGIDPGKAKATPVMVRRQQACNVSRGSEENHLNVNCANERYRVVFFLSLRREPATQADVRGGIDFSRIWFDLEVCRGNVRVRVRPSVNVGQVLRDIAENLISRDPALQNVTINPELEIQFQIGGSHNLTARGGPFIDIQTGRVVGVGLSVAGTFGQGSEEIDCSDERRFLNMRCERVTTIPGQPAREAVSHQETRHIYFLFPHAASTPIESFRIAVEDQNPIAAAENDTITQIQSLSAQGFRVASITGFTSPEGPRDKILEFIGNNQLGENRANSAQNWLETNCTECGAGDVTPAGSSELYSPGTTPETDGNRLTRIVTPRFLDENDPLAPVGEQDRNTLRQNTPQQQRTEIYPLLRRATVVMKRSVENSPAVPAIPESESFNSVGCPSVVRQAVKTELGFL